MAGMFYSLQEVAKKLNITEEEVKALAKEGKLREFRDGSKLLFKADEVEALMPAAGAPVSEEVPAEETPTPTPEPSAAETPIKETPVPSEQPAEEEEISLAPETGTPVAPSELTDADTAITAEGVSVLGEADRDYPVTDDTMAETTVAPDTTGTIGVAGKTGTTPEAPLEESGEDVSLDSFGSGSGLLDLSLQADDTSLGGILDEIYTAEGAEGKEPAPAGTAEEVVAEAEHVLPEEELVAAQPAVGAPAIAQPYIEPAPDVQSNTFGMLLILPLLALLYTAVVAVAGQRGVVPSILEKIHSVIWYIVIAAVVITGLVVGAAFWLSGDIRLFTGGPKKSAKEKKPKKSKKAEESPPAASEETTT